MSSDYSQDAVEAYERAAALAEYARRTWEEAGSPLTLTRPSGVIRPHPLVAIVLDCEAAAARRLERARVKHRGPSPTAVVQAHLGESPAQKLRAVPPSG